MPDPAAVSYTHLVGYDLYVKMLGQAIARAKGEPVQRDKSECLVDLRVDAYKMCIRDRAWARPK